MGAHNEGDDLVRVGPDDHQPQPLRDDQFPDVRRGVSDVLHGFLLEDGARQHGVYLH